MERFDVIVIGGGLLGCFAARALSRYQLSVALLERREDVMTGISRANTAIIYSGYDTKPGTLKTEMCVRASQGFDKLCGELGVRYSRCGSIMAAFGERGERVLRDKLRQGEVNGVRGLRLLSRDETLRLEPNLSGTVTMGLYSPDTGTVIPWELGVAAAENAAANGVRFFFNSGVTAIERRGDGYVVACGGAAFHARGIINCAGISADSVLEMAFEPALRIAPSSGDYLVFDTKVAGLLNHVVFHEPEERGKGLTLVPTVDGNLLAGPLERPLTGEDYATSREGLGGIRSLIAEVMPTLPTEHVIRSFGALRPNPYKVSKKPDGTFVREDTSINEFAITESSKSPPFLSLAGIKTPGLTCAHELGLHVSDMIAELLCANPEPDFDPHRPSPVRVSELPPDERARIVRENPAYGNIVCRCREISEGEVLGAIRAVPGAVTLGGVKRRAGTCLGRCQGSFCTERIIEILARELGVNPEDVMLDGDNSYILRKGQNLNYEF